MSSNHTWALTNGTIGTLEDFYVEDIRFPYWIYKNPVPFMYAQLRLDDDDTFCGVPIDYNQLLTGKRTFEGKQIYQIKKIKIVLTLHLIFIRLCYYLLEGSR